MKPHLVLLSFYLCLLALGGVVRESEATLPGCMKCHGDEAAMKTMVKPVIRTSTEGEG